MDRSELILLLSDAARDGSVTAIKLLLEQHRLERAKAESKPDLIGQLRERRTTRLGE